MLLEIPWLSICCKMAHYAVHITIFADMSTLVARRPCFGNSSYMRRSRIDRVVLVLRTDARNPHIASLKQASAGIRPFIVIDELNEKDYANFEMRLKPISAEKIIIIRNLGRGHAMDIKWALGGRCWYTH